MNENKLSQLSKQALASGFMIMPFAANDIAEKALRMEALNHIIRDTLIYQFVIEYIIDRLTYVRDYLIKKSIEFMIIAKDMNGKTAGVAHFIYSKSSNLMYLKNYMLKENVGAEGKIILAFMVSGARDYMSGYGFNPNAIISSPSVKQDGFAAINSMRDLGMKFITFEPKIETIENEIRRATPVKTESSESLRPLQSEITVFPVKKDEKITDLRVIMAAKYGTGKFTLDEVAITKFLADLVAEEELHVLYTLLGNSKFIVSLGKIDETAKLISLLETLKTNDGL